MTARSKALFAAVVAAFIGACASPAPIPVDRFYRLDPAPPPATGSKPWTGGVLYVPPFDGSGVYAERAVLVSDDAGTSLVQRRYDFWADEPGRLLQHALVDHLRSAGTAGTVTASRPRTGAALTLSGRIVRFDLERLDSGYVPVVAVAFELDDAYGQPVAAETFEARGEAGSLEAGLGRGFSPLIGDLFSRITRVSAQALGGSDAVARSGEGGS